MILLQYRRSRTGAAALLSFLKIETTRSRTDTVQKDVLRDPALSQSRGEEDQIWGECHD